MIRRGEERAVSTIIGAVLILGILVTALALYQVNVVPDDNRAVEYEHHQGVQSQLLDVRNGLVNAPDRRVGSYSVALGTTYPTRTFTINPPPSSGTLETVGENRTIRLENVEVEGGDVGDYWNERELEFNTSSLVYQPRYNEYRNAPTIVYENSVLFNEQNGGQAALSGQRLVDGNTIQLVLLEGEYSSSQSGTVAVDFETVSASSNTINLSATNNDNITIQVPSELNESVWNRLLDDGATASAGADGYVEIELDGNSYDLQIAKVGLGSNYQDGKDGEAYLTVVDPPRSTIQQGDSTRMTVEVRDGYNNPVSGVKVNGSTDGDGTLEPTSASSNSKGQVTFQYTAGEPDNDEVTLEANFTSNSSEYQRVTETIEVREGSSGGSGGGGGLYEVWWSENQESPLEDCDDVGCGEDYRVNQGEENVRFDAESEASEANADFSYNDKGDVGIRISDSTDFDENGNSWVELTDFNEEGVFDLFVYSGGSSDLISVLVEPVVSGQVDIQNEIREGDQDFEVTTSNFENLDTNSGGYLVVENEDEGEAIVFEDVGEDTISVTELGFSEGDTLTASLYEAENEENLLDTDSTEVIGDNEAFFAVEITETNDPVEEGEDLNVTAEITNTGDVEGTQTIELNFESDQVDSQEVTLAGGANETVTLTYRTEAGDAGDRNVIVSSNDDSDTQQVSIEGSGEPPAIDSFEVTNPSSNNYDVTWEVSDSDGDLSQVTIELLKNDNVQDDKTIQVSGTNASGTDSLSTGQPDEVRLIVTDNAGNQTSETKIIE
ncbi:Ig-like domain-containing protein [Natrialbaceae archaeon A-CW2]